MAKSVMVFWSPLAAGQGSKRLPSNRRVELIYQVFPEHFCKTHPTARCDIDTMLACSRCSCRWQNTAKYYINRYRGGAAEKHNRCQELLVSLSQIMSTRITRRRGNG